MDNCPIEDFENKNRLDKCPREKKEEDIVFIRKIIYQMREKNIRGRNKRKMGKVGGRKS